ncbi:MAG: urease accessory protein UreD [Pseudomonadota bacterium]
MNEQTTLLAPLQPRARGQIRASLDVADGKTRLATLRQAGSSRALFPRIESRYLQMVLTNTSGGVTGGDRFRTDVTLLPDAQVSLTTQAAERAYRAQPGQIGSVETVLRVGQGGRLSWLPQETILFDGCAFKRRLTLEFDARAEALIVEPLVFGRTAMGERLSHGFVDDRIEVISDGQTVFLDRTKLSGDIARLLDRQAVAASGGATALLVFASPRAELYLESLRDLLPPAGGASLKAPELLVARLVATDGYDLRRSLIPIIEHLHDDVIPRPWTI